MILNTCTDHSVTYKKIEESASQFPKYSRKKVHHYLVVTPVEIIIRYIIQIYCSDLTMKLHKVSKYLDY